MTAVFVNYQQICEHSEREDVQFGSWSRQYSFSVKSVSLQCPSKLGYSDEYDEIEVGVDVVGGDEIYVIHMCYSSGDSFGKSSGQGEIVWAFKNRLVAEDAFRDIEKQMDKKEYSFKFTGDTGEVVTLANPAYGYFENCESLDLTSFIVGNTLSKR